MPQKESAPKGEKEQQVSALLERLSRLNLPGEQNAQTIDEFTHQLLIVGLKDLNMLVKIGDDWPKPEIEGQAYSTYVYSDKTPIRKRNFDLLEHMIREIVPVKIEEVKGRRYKTKKRRFNKRAGRLGVSIRFIHQDYSQVYEWEIRTVERLKIAHPDSVFVKGLEQALSEYLSKD